MTPIAILEDGMHLDTLGTPKATPRCLIPKPPNHSPNPPIPPDPNPKLPKWGIPTHPPIPHPTPTEEHLPPRHLGMSPS